MTILYRRSASYVGRFTGSKSPLFLSHVVDSASLSLYLSSTGTFGVGVDDGSSV